MSKFEEILAAKLEKLAEEDKAFRLAMREDLAAEVEEFYNHDHGPDGRFDVGSDGPGRKRDNLKKTQAVLGKKVPQAIQNILSRRLGKARVSAEKLLPKGAAAYQKGLIGRNAESRVLHGGDENSAVTRNVQKGIAPPLNPADWNAAEKKATGSRKKKGPTPL